MGSPGVKEEALPPAGCLYWPFFNVSADGSSHRKPQGSQPCSPPPPLIRLPRESKRPPALAPRPPSRPSGTMSLGKTGGRKDAGVFVRETHSEG
jgi:hypothetical protein